MEASSDMGRPPPSWIDNEFIESALRNKEQKEVTVESVSVRYASVEGYSSHMFRVKASVKIGSSEDVKNEFIFVKVALDCGVVKELMENTQVFVIESLILHELLPQMHERLASVEGDASHLLGPQCYMSGRQPAEFLVMEDLSAAGFRIAEAGIPLDQHHCSLVLRAYARLHASSAHLLKTQPEYKDKLAANSYTGEQAQKYYSTLVSKLFSVLAGEMEKCPGFEQYVDKYRRLGDKVFDVEYEIIGRCREETKLTVLLHGDCWKNNIMFKYKEGNATEIRLVDFQMATFGSPAADLQYFLFGNASEDVHRYHMDRLLREYYGTLTDLLRRLGLEEEAEAYSFQELQRDLERCWLGAVCFSAMSPHFLTSWKYGAEYAKAYEDLDNADEAFAKTYQNPYSLSYMKYLTPIFDRKGYI